MPVASPMSVGSISVGSISVASTAGFEASAMRKFRWRMIPLLAICYFIYRLDLLNVGFAGLTMNKELGLSATAFGFGVGVFYWGFFLCQIPSNLALERWGAKLWLPIIMLLWSVLSGCMALVSSQHGFYIMRFILGAADAGFFPGIIFYLTYWTPAAYRGRMVSLFSLGGLLAPILGGPLAGGLLKLDGLAGISGWRWLFISEAIPAVILAAVLASMIVNRPADARWLSADERAALEASLDDERAKRDALQKLTVVEAMRNPKVILLCVIYLGILGGISGTGFWLPLILQGFGLSNQQVGWVAAIPYAVAMIGLLTIAAHSDRTGERIWHVAIPILFACAGFVAAGFWIHDSYLAIVAVSVALAGGQGAIAVFWSLPPAFLSGPMAAASVALINAVGNLGGFFGPQIIGYLRDRTGSFSWAMIAMALFPLMAAVVVTFLGRDAGMRRALNAERTAKAPIK
jgi:MFS transporter, ACS family, tartrate transporter